MGRNYNDSEVDAILQRALSEQGDINHEDLVAAAAEIGVTRDAIERAAERLDERTEEADAIVEARQKRKQRFQASMMTFVIVNIFLFAIDMLTGGGWWFYWPLLSWGMLMALQGSKLLQPEPVPKTLVRRRRKAKKDAERVAEKAQRANRNAAAAKRFEDAVDGGVAALFGALAKRIEGVTPSKAKEADGEFARYVAQKSGQKMRVAKGDSTAKDTPSARVVNFEDDYSEEELAEAERELEQELQG